MTPVLIVKKALTVSWDTEATTNGDLYKRYTSNYYCPEHGSKQFETEREMLHYTVLQTELHFGAAPAGSLIVTRLFNRARF
jgi:hypothetical protein